MTIAEIIASLNAAVTNDAQRTEAINALHTTMQPVYQAIYDRGHGQATAALQTKVTAAEQARDQANADKAAAESALEEAKKGKGGADVEQLRTQHAADLKAVQDKAKEREQALQQSLEGERLRRAKSDLRSQLKGKLVEDLIDVKVEHPDIVKRIRFRENGDAFVVQNGTEVELQVPAGQSAFGLLADEIYQATPATLRLSKVEEGAGTDPANPGAGGGYDPAAAGKKMAEATKPQADMTALALR